MFSLRSIFLEGDKQITQVQHMINVCHPLDSLFDTIYALQIKNTAAENESLLKLSLFSF